MNRTRRQEIFWLLVIAACIVLFVSHRQNQPKTAAYDRSGMTELFRQADDVFATGSIAKPLKRPVSHKRGYYVPLGSYGSVEQATRRYLEVVNEVPELERQDKVSIETVSTKGNASFHRVRMGDFANVSSAKAACARAGLLSSQCPVVEVR